jgi:hypothetical protein
MTTGREPNPLIVRFSLSARRKSTESPRGTARRRSYEGDTRLWLIDRLTEQETSQATGFDDEIQPHSIAESQRAGVFCHPFTKRVESLLADSGGADQPCGIRFGLNRVAWKKQNLVESKEDLIFRISLSQEPGGNQQAVAKRARHRFYEAERRALLKQRTGFEAAIEACNERPLHALRFMRKSLKSVADGAVKPTGDIVLVRYHFDARSVLPIILPASTREPVAEAELWSNPNHGREEPDGRGVVDNRCS